MKLSHLSLCSLFYSLHVCRTGHVWWCVLHCRPLSPGRNSATTEIWDTEGGREEVLKPDRAGAFRAIKRPLALLFPSSHLWLCTCGYVFSFRWFSISSSQKGHMLSSTECRLLSYERDNSFESLAHLRPHDWVLVIQTTFYIHSVAAEREKSLFECCFEDV